MNEIREILTMENEIGENRNQTLRFGHLNLRFGEPKWFRFDEPKSPMVPGVGGDDDNDVKEELPTHFSSQFDGSSNVGEIEKKNLSLFLRKRERGKTRNFFFFFLFVQNATRVIS